MSKIKGNITRAFGQNSCHENHNMSAKTLTNGYHKKCKSPKTVFKIYVSIILFKYLIPKRLKVGKN